MRTRFPLSTAILGGATLALVALYGCGSGSSPTGSTSGKALTQTESQLVASEIFAAAFSGLSNVTFSSMRAHQASLIQPTATFSGPCDGGGTATGTVTYAYTLNAQGTGNESASVSLVDQDCGVNTGSRVIDIDGTLTYAFNMSLTQYALTTYSADATGSFSWSGNSCNIDYHIAMTGTGHYTLSGNFCGYTISASD